jgi:UTP--glucose-1-phosphate uridylyltransferase
MIRKAVIPAAGFGTRFLPASKSQPKEMLPIIDKPTIHYVVEEAVASGITDILMIIGKGKRAIEEYFDRNFELEAELEQKGKTEELRAIRKITSIANIHFVWQKELNGLGDAIAHAQCHVGNEPFAVLLGDTIIESKGEPVTRQLMELHARYSEPIVALEKVKHEYVGRYGVIRGNQISPGIHLIDDFIEKPSPDEAPSNLAIASRYVFTPNIFEYLDRTERGKNNEIQLTDAMRLMVREHAMYGLQFEGMRYDIGNKLDYMKTNIIHGLQSAEFGDDLRAFLKAVIKAES